MSRPRPESADSDTRDHSVAADVLLRQEPDEEEDEEEDEYNGARSLPLKFSRCEAANFSD
jgi:hypothetical protein